MSNPREPSWVGRKTAEAPDADYKVASRACRRETVFFENGSRLRARKKTCKCTRGGGVLGTLDRRDRINHWRVRFVGSLSNNFHFRGRQRIGCVHNSGVHVSRLHVGQHLPYILRENGLGIYRVVDSEV